MVLDVAFEHASHTPYVTEHYHEGLNGGGGGLVFTIH